MTRPALQLVPPPPPKTVDAPTRDEAGVADTEVGKLFGGLQRSWYEGGRIRITLGKGPVR